MNFQQLRSLRETVRRGLNLTAAAEALHTSQPALSKQIRELEEELGVPLFVRRGKKFTRMTEAGERILRIAERLLAEADEIRRTGAEYAAGDTGTLAIAATHTQARYALPGILSRFRVRHPRMRLHLHQGSPSQVAAWVEHGEATFGLATEALDAHPLLQTFPAYTWRHCLVVPEGHPLAARPTADLADVAAHPLITYSPDFAGRRNIDRALAARGLAPEVALEAIDSDVIKTYVAMGFGVGIIADIAFDPARDRGLVKVDLGDALPGNVAKVAVRAGAQLRAFERTFLEIATGKADDAARAA